MNTRLAVPALCDIVPPECVKFPPMVKFPILEEVPLINKVDVPDIVKLPVTIKVLSPVAPVPAIDTLDEPEIMRLPTVTVVRFELGILTLPVPVLAIVNVPATENTDPLLVLPIRKVLV